MDGHCATCTTYEAAVMAGEASTDVAPCDGYVMTDAFRQWMVDSLRAEVLGQVAASGLDRMAILKDSEE